VGKDGPALAAHELVHPLRHPVTHVAHHVAETLAPRRLDDQVNVVALDGEVGQETVPLGNGSIERPAQDPVRTPAAEIPDLAPDAQGEVKRQPRIHLAADMRHPTSIARPPALAAATAGPAEAEVELRGTPSATS